MCVFNEWWTSEQDSGSIRDDLNGSFGSEIYGPNTRIKCTQFGASQVHKTIWQKSYPKCFNVFCIFLLSLVHSFELFHFHTLAQCIPSFLFCLTISISRSSYRSTTNITLGCVYKYLTHYFSLLIFRCVDRDHGDISWIFGQCRRQPNKCEAIAMTRRIETETERQERNTISSSCA